MHAFEEIHGDRTHMRKGAPRCSCAVEQHALVQDSELVGLGVIPFLEPARRDDYCWHTT